jgi:hypothetical protein
MKSTLREIGEWAVMLAIIGVLTFLFIYKG